MPLRVIDLDAPEFAALKKKLEPNLSTLEALGGKIVVFAEDTQEVGAVYIGKEPLQLLEPIGTPLSRFFVLNFEHPPEILEEFAIKAMDAAKDANVFFAYIIIPADQSKLAAKFEELGFQRYAEKYTMELLLEAPKEPQLKLRYEQVKREEMDRFQKATTEFMSGSPDVVLNRILQNLQTVPEQFLDLWFQQVQLFFVYKEKELVGILDLTPSNGEINNIGVAKQHRGKGYGSEMLDFSLNLIRASGCDKAHLDVVVENTQALQLYKKKGFEIKAHTKVLLWHR